MKGKIDKYGNLWLERAGKMRRTECPFAKGDSKGGSYKDGQYSGTTTYVNTTSKPCGHWCSLFGEPDTVKKNETGEKYTELQLCEVAWFFTEFIDERVTNDD